MYPRCRSTYRAVVGASRARGFRRAATEVGVSDNQSEFVEEEVFLTVLFSELQNPRGIAFENFELRVCIMLSSTEERDATCFIVVERGNHTFLRI